MINPAGAPGSFEGCSLAEPLGGGAGLLESCGVQTPSALACGVAGGGLAQCPGKSVSSL